MEKASTPKNTYVGFFDHESRLDNPSFNSLALALFEQRNMLKDRSIENILENTHPENNTVDLFAAMGKMMGLTTRDFQRTIDIIDSIRLTSNSSLNIILLGFLTMLCVAHSDLFKIYEQSPSGHAIHKDFLNRCDKRITFSDSEDLNDYNSHRKISVAASEWLMRYLDGLWMDKPYEYEGSWIYLRNAINYLVEAEQSGSPCVVRLYGRNGVVGIAGAWHIDT